ASLRMLRAMRRSTLDELARDPVGRYVAGDCFLHFCAAPDFWGIVLWGKPDHRQAMELGRSLVLGLSHPAEPHVTLLDASRLEGSDPAAFRAAERYITDFGPALARHVRRLALVRPSGMNGAVVAGAFEVLPRPFPTAVFGDPAEACAWLGLSADGAALAAALHGEVAGTPRVLPALRAWLDQHLAGVTVEDAARALALSARSLQRKLAEAGTTFTAELAEARVRAARRMLADGDAPLTAIAYDVGCASLQHFSALFRRRMHESPSAFRARLHATR
ncbi:MAG TPA: helix-turn-helix domain-containing protein, partial [Kofleriaceae bacterium]|nr:helix-turn-helix domain-containing protein [Kofleriaceae bacterium]